MKISKKWCVRGGNQLSNSDFRIWSGNPNNHHGESAYYLFDGSQLFDYHQTIDYLNNLEFREYPLISFECFRDNFLKIPVEWYVKCTKETSEILVKWRDGGYIGQPEDSVLLSHKEWCNIKYIPSEYKEITFKQFEKHILKKKEIMDIYRNIGTELPYIPMYTHQYQTTNGSVKYGLRKSQQPFISFGSITNGSGEVMILAEESNYIGSNYYMFRESDLLELAKTQISSNKKIIGYKLKNIIFKKAVENILNCPNFNFDEFKTDANGFTLSIKCMEELGVLDIWFTPIYESEFKVGDFVTLCVESNQGLWFEKSEQKTFKLTAMPQMFDYGMCWCTSGIHDIETIKAGYGIPEKFFRKATQEEIEAIYIMQGFTSKIDKENHRIIFGCRDYSHDEVQILLHAMDILDEIGYEALITGNTLMLHGGDSLKKEQIQKIHKLIK